MMSCASGNSRRLSIKFMCVTLPYMSIGRCVIRAVALQQIDHAPHGKASAQRHDESLQGSNGRSKKLHKSSISPGGKAPAMKKAAISGGSYSSGHRDQRLYKGVRVVEVVIVEDVLVLA